MVWNGEARLVEAGLCAERFGWRVMVRLGAVLCGTVMYGLVWQAGLGADWRGMDRIGRNGMVRYVEVRFVPDR